MTDTVVLDLDGTLVDSVYEHVCAWKLAFRRVGLEVSAVEIHRAIGMGGDKLVSAVAGAAVERDAGDEVRRLHDEIFWSVIDDVRPLRGADELVRAIDESGRVAVLASSSPADQVDRMLSHLEGRSLIRHLVTGDDVDASKPDPDIVEAALAAAGSRNAVLVGDAVWDVESAARAGIGCLTVRSGGLGADELLGAGALAVYASPHELARDLPHALAGAGDRPTRAVRITNEEAGMPKAWSAKRERQYDHIKEGLEERGRGEDEAEEIAARTVNKERARAGEAEQSSRLSREDISSGRRGGMRSHQGEGGRTKAQLYEDAKRAQIKGRSTMTKAESLQALGER